MDVKMIFNKVKLVVANAFDIGEDDVSPSLRYQEIQQWDSLNHIHLMLALEQEFNVKIDENRVLMDQSSPAIDAALKCGFA